jgi:DNA polymerase-3 subunit alpha
MASPQEYAERAAQFHHPALAVTDHGRLSAIWENQQACKKVGIKPIIGIELYLADELETLDAVTQKRIRGRSHHLILLAKNEKGYKNLLKLNYISMKDEQHFYYLPRVLKEELFEHSEGLMLGTGCFGNPFLELARKGEMKALDEYFGSYYEVFKNNMYVEVQINELTNEVDRLKQGQLTANKIMMALASKYNLPIVLTGDVHYLEKGHEKHQDLAIAIRDKVSIDKLGFRLEARNLYFHDEKDYFTFNEEYKYGYAQDDIRTWLKNSEMIAEQCNYQIPERERMYLPTVTENDDAELIKKGRAGLVKRFGLRGYEEVPEEYRKRLERELEVVIRKGFSSYLLIVEDITQFSIREKIYGRMGRGSVGGSLLAYSLGIHNLDPIKYGLLFERFLSDSRSPDKVLDYFCE